MVKIKKKILVNNTKYIKRNYYVYHVLQDILWIKIIDAY